MRVPSPIPLCATSHGVGLLFARFLVAGALRFLDPFKLGQRQFQATHSFAPRSFHSFL